MKTYIDCLFKISLFYCIVSFTMFKFPVGHDRGTNWIYAFGNKFSTSYYFILMDSLFCIKYADKLQKEKKYRLRLVFLLVMSLLYMYLVDCMTAAFSLILASVLFFVLGNRKLILMRPYVVFFAVIVSLLFPLILAFLIQNDTIKNFTYVTLGRKRTIGGRMNIYSMYLFQLIRQRFILGFGYGSGVMNAVTEGYYANTQNGLLEHVYNFGILGAVFLVVFIIRCYKNSSKSYLSIYSSIVVYALLFASLIEVTYNFAFFLGLALVRWLPDNTG